MINLQPFKDQLQKASFVINYEENGTTTRVKHTIDEITIDFFLHYSCKRLNYSSATYSQPEEYDLKFTNNDHSDVEISIAGEYPELSEEEILSIEEILIKKLY